MTTDRGARHRRSPAPIREVPLPGPVPRFELPGWREQYGVLAGVTGRGSGEGRGFDLGLWTDAPVGEVVGRWRTLRRTSGFSATVLAHQVHGAEILTHDTAGGWQIHDGADGHVTTAAGLLLTVTVADCIPVYLVAAERRGVALLHAGWRGAAAGILGRGVERLCHATGCAPGDLVMHTGVGICGGCYEVGSDVLEGCGVVPEGQGPWRFDLRAWLADRAAELGIGTLTTSGWCTAHDPEQFFSHRGSAGRDGRQVAYLGIPRPIDGGHAVG